MPTYAWTARFRADFDRLTRAPQAAFLEAVEQFVADLGKGRKFRKGLRVKGVKGAHGIFEVSWSPDGWATFQHGEEVVAGQAHIVWRRIGTHAVFGRP